MGHPPGACQLQVGAQVFQPLVGRALGVQVLRVEAGEHHDLAPRPRDGHIEPAMAVGVAEGPEAQRHIAALVDGEVRENRMVSRSSPWTFSRSRTNRPSRVSDRDRKSVV